MQPRRFVLAAVWILAGVAILPVFYHWPARTPHTGADAYARTGLGYLAALVICWCIYRVETPRLGCRGAFSLAFLVLLLTSITNNLHGFMIDHGPAVLPFPNLQWQIAIQDAVIRLDSGAIPHNYRFLPNAIVRWMQVAHIAYEPARDLYRLIAGLVLFYAIYRYARLYTNHLGATLAMLFTACIFPVSFEHYAGQLTDPLSHLSFVLALIFLETGDYAALLATLVIGSLAKESVLAMTGYYLLFCRKENKYPLKAIGLCGATAAAYLGVRMLVLKGNLHYGQVSGVTIGHVGENWLDPQWKPVFLLTAAALLPFLALAWKETPLSLKRQASFLLAALFLSSLFFSWLREARNFMPLVVVLSVIAGRYWAESYGSTADGARSVSEREAMRGT